MKVLQIVGRTPWGAPSGSADPPVGLLAIATA